MALSNDLISQFVKATQDKQQTKKESTAYGRIVKQGDVEYVQLDGSDLLTPISSTTTVKDGDRVMVTIKNHTAIVTGDFTNPSANDSDVKEIGSKITEFEIIVADKVVAQDIEAINGYFENITAISGKYTELSAVTAEVETLKAKYANMDHITATDVEIINAEIETLKGKFGEFVDLSAEDLTAINAEFDNVVAYNASFTYVSADKLKALKADIDSAEIKYANIDFANIGSAAIEQLFSLSGIIKDLVMNDTKVTGELVGVTIKGDLIEGNTVVADKLVIKGEDGLFYKLNIDALGEATASADEKYKNGLDGSVIVAKSITAEKVAVTDLVAFGATIGGYHIDEHSLYSGTKESATNTTRGVFLGDDGQFAVGDSSNYLRFFKDENGEYKLEFRVGNSSVDEAIDRLNNLNVGARNLILNSNVEVNSADYNVAKYTPSDFLIEGEEYTISMCVTPAEGLTFYGYYLSSGSKQQGILSVNGTDKQIVSGTFTASYKENMTPENAERYGMIWIYRFPNDGTVTGNSIIHWIKVEKGNTATDWTPAPEDIENELTSNYYNKTETDAKLQIQDDKISSTVTKVENLEIGARNYIVLSKLSTFKDYNTLSTVIDAIITTTRKTASTVSFITLRRNDWNPPNDYMTLSGYIKVNGQIPETDFFTGLISTYGSDLINRIYDNTTGYFEYTQKYPGGNSGGSDWIIHAKTNTTIGQADVITFEKLKFEKGTKATDWTLSPEDLSDEGRNLWISSYPTVDGNTKDGYTIGGAINEGWARLFVDHDTTMEMLKPSTTYTLSYKFRLDSLAEGSVAYNQPNHGSLLLYSGADATKYPSVLIGLAHTKQQADTWEVGTIIDSKWTFTTPSTLDVAGAQYRILAYTRRSMESDGTTLITHELGTFYDIKLEEGTRATDWTAAPEDINGLIADVEDSMGDRIETTNTAVRQAQSSIDQLAEMISHLITDGNGGSLMTQTDNGWTFNMSSISGNLNAIKDAIENMEADISSADSSINKLTNLIDSVANKTAYITIGTDDSGNPCIILGKTSNTFKVRITNTAIDFLEGSAKIAYANNNTFYSEKMIVKNELQIGEGPGFVWKVRSNGNMGLVYIS